MKLLYCCVLAVLAGCAKQAQGPAKPDIHGQTVQLIHDEIEFASDCLRVDHDTWVAEDCAARKAELLKRSDDIDAQEKAKP